MRTGRSSAGPRPSDRAANDVLLGGRQGGSRKIENAKSRKNENAKERKRAGMIEKGDGEMEGMGRRDEQNLEHNGAIEMMRAGGVALRPPTLIDHLPLPSVSPHLHS